MPKLRIPTYISYWVALIFFLLITDPNHLPVGFLVIPFGILGLAVYKTWLAFTAGSRSTNGRKILGLIITFTLVACLGLQSIGEFTPRDFLIVVLFAAIAYFYAARSLKA
jgi:hypothetical protein